MSKYWDQLQKRDGNPLNAPKPEKPEKTPPSKYLPEPIDIALQGSSGDGPPPLWEITPPRRRR